MTYDPQCEELARYFLRDEPAGSAEAREGQVNDLAGVIQRAVEDWIAENIPA
jgi:hypothetical protein